MDYDEFKRNLGKAGLTIREFASLMCLHTNSISNYAATEHVPSHLAVAVALMGEMAEHQLDFRVVLARIDLKPKRARGAALKGKFGGSKQAELPMEME